jgi:hypothetical protein
MGKLKRFGQALGNTFKNIGTASSKIMANLEKADKELEMKMKKGGSVT